MIIAYFLHDRFSCGCYYQICNWEYGCKCQAVGGMHLFIFVCTVFYINNFFSIDFSCRYF